MTEPMTRLGFDHPLPGWGWLLAILGIALVVALVYGRQRAPMAWRVALATVRGLQALLLVLLLLGPRIEHVMEERQRDVVVLLVDRSASLTIEDVPFPAGGAARESREDQARRAMESGTGDGRAWTTALAEGHEVIALGFDGDVRLMDAGIGAANLVEAMGAPTGTATDLHRAVGEALRRTAGRTVSAFVIVSDGRSESTVPGRVRRELTARGIAVVAVPLGSPEVSRDLEVLDVDAPRRAYVRDPVPVRVSLRSTGRPPAGPVRVTLVTAGPDGADVVVDEATVDPGAWSEGRAQAVVVAQSDDPGDKVFRLVAEPDGGMAADLVVSNNERAVTMSFADEPLRILYLEGYPRWEYRYIKNMLVREETVESSVMLVSADLDFAQEGNVPLARMPQTDEEFAQFDLFIIGDVPGSFLSPGQVDAMRRAVGDRGAGLLWLGGERATPATWRGTALEDLLPFKQPDIRSGGGSWSVAPARAAERLGLLRMDESGGWPEALRPPAQRWARLAWCQEMAPSNLKPVVEVIAEAVPLDGGDATPVVTLMRYGAGEVIYVGTDETWRWRHGIGETLQERFWIQLLRHLARTSLAVRGAPATVEVDPSPAKVDQECTVRVQLRDSARDPAEFDPLAVTVIEPDGQRSALGLTRQGSTGHFSGAFRPRKAGAWQLVLDDPRLGDSVGVTLRVEPSNEELANPAADHEVLARLAEESGGAVVAPGDAGSIPSYVPDRTRMSERIESEPLWHTWWVLAMLVGLSAVEWIGRRLVRLA